MLLLLLLLWYQVKKNQSLNTFFFLKHSRSPRNIYYYLVGYYLSGKKIYKKKSETKPIIRSERLREREEFVVPIARLCQNNKKKVFQVFRLINWCITHTHKYRHKDQNMHNFSHFLTEKKNIHWHIMVV